MILFILALLFGIVVFVLLLKNIKKNTKERLKYGNRWEKVCEIIKIILFAETAIYLIIFIIVIIKTILA